MSNSNLTVKFLRTEKEKIQPNSFTKLTITLVVKPGKNFPKKENYSTI